MSFCRCWWLCNTLFALLCNQKAIMEMQLLLTHTDSHTCICDRWRATAQFQFRCNVKMNFHLRYEFIKTAAFGMAKRMSPLTPLLSASGQAIKITGFTGKNIPFRAMGLPLSTMNIFLTPSRGFNTPFYQSDPSYRNGILLL